MLKKLTKTKVTDALRNTFHVTNKPGLKRGNCVVQNTNQG